MTETLKTNITIDMLIENANRALEEIKDYTQEQTDRMVHSVGQEVMKNVEKLSELAAEETDMGTPEDHANLVNGFTTVIWSQLKGKKSVGEIERDEEAGIVKIAHPIGVVANVTPVTAPVSGPIGNGMLALKGKNASIVSPAPSSKEASKLTVELMREGLRKVGAPEDLVQIVPEPSIEASGEAMAKADVVIATGGPGLVKAAYSSGTPAFGVGAGNAQLIYDETDDLQTFAKDTVAARLFNYATACMCTQTMLYPKNSETELREALEKEGAFWIDDEETVDHIRNVLFGEDGKLNTNLVGQDFDYLMEQFGLSVPEGTKILITKTDKFGEDELLAKEKAVPIINAYAYDTFEEALEVAAANLALIGEGHSSAIYTKDEEKIYQAGDKLKVSRLMVNQPTSSANNGPKNSLIATMSMGCGFWGGNSTNDLLDYKHLLNIQRIVYEMEQEPIPDNVWDFE